MVMVFWYGLPETERQAWLQTGWKTLATDGVKTRRLWRDGGAGVV